MERRRLGRTNLKASILGLGGIGFARREVSSIESKKLINFALDSGVNIIDTARIYGDSEKRIGEALQERGEKGDCIIVSKTMQRYAESAWKEIKVSLELLQVDRIDVYMIHDLKWDKDFDAVFSQGGALQALKVAKASGKIGFIGVSGHTPQMMRRVLETNEFDVIQIPYNPIDQELFEDVIPEALKRDVGIMVMKPLCGGVIKNVSLALRFVFAAPVTTAIPGAGTVEEVITDLRIAREYSKLSEDERQELFCEAEELGRLFCRRCGYCEKRCPAGIPISDILRFERYKTSYFSGDWAKSQYKRLEINAKACQECGACEEACPYDLPVCSMLKRAHHELTKPEIKKVLVRIADTGKHYLLKVMKG
jgi:hypothetical protein